MDLDRIHSVIIKQKEHFNRGETRPLAVRQAHLEALRQAVKRYEAEIIAALRADLGKSELEAYSTEIGFLLEEIRFVSKRMKGWAKPRKVKTAPTHIGSRGVIIPEPYGTALIIAPWNYPFQLALSPLVCAIAAGNTAVLKPSELTPTVSALLARLVADTFAPEVVAVIEGGVEETTELLRQPFDYIFFTGSVPVGRIVMEAAAKRLIPVTLELGGKSPCIVHRDAKLELAAKRIAFGKFANSGQTCIAPDYLLVHEEVKDELLRHLQAAVEEFYGREPVRNPDYGRIVSRRHYDRLVRFLGDGRSVFGGQSDDEALRIAPTALDGVSPEAPVMQEEIFGPILPVLTYREIGETIAAVNAKPKPLALYLFTEDAGVQREVVEKVSFGGGCINDTLMHIATPYLPFGGVGESGMGSYHGESSFKAFSHFKSVLKQTTLFDIAFRYPSAKNGLKLMRRFMK
ncbi:YwdH [Paenibacillus mucilaginosus 3016]|uniref:Aldehyde dehydrogenase n=1 Tax=Paenibacillus mucilaginosus 3016 TaxID=1116391 RepID=H6NC40_9BACL|nr:aldehyde dehydrogenase [Paenibacillus mucilaginosus]AFC28233.1 YwdH [Paenibacillus mucilaginosus 3016]WFA22485.1 aldehyde dehydrogenase [Paenibacillus mucilaginosus]